MTTTTVTLSTPINTHDGEKASITLKMPRARSFFSHGEPFRVRVVTEGEATRVEIDYNHSIFAKFLSDMSGLDEGLLGNITALDYYALRSGATDLILGVAGSNPTPT